MLILKYFLTVGLLLTATVWALGSYFDGGSRGARASHGISNATTTSLAIAKPTPAPPVAAAPALDEVPVIPPKAEKAARSTPRRAAHHPRETNGWDRQNQGWQSRGGGQNQGNGQSQGWGGWGRQY